MIGKIDRLRFGFEGRHRGDGPKSFLDHAVCPGRDIGEDGGLEEVTPEVRDAVTTAEEPCAEIARIANVDEGAGECGGVYEWAEIGGGIEAIPHVEGRDPVGKAGQEGFVGGVLDVDPVDGDAGLAVVPELGGEDAIDGGVHVRILKNEGGSLSAEFEAEGFDGLGGVADEVLADLGGSGEGDFADGWVGEEFGGDVGGGAEDDLKDAAGELDLVCAGGEGEGGEGSLAGGFQDDGTAGGEGWGDFAHDQHEGEVPGCDGADDPDGGLDHEVALGFDRRGDDPAIGPTGFLGEPPEVIKSEGDFAGALGEGFAGFERDGAGDVFATAFEFGGEAIQPFPAGLWGEGAPGEEGGLGMLNGGGDRWSIDDANLGEGFGGGRVVDRDGLIGFDESAVEVQRVELHLADSVRPVGGASEPKRCSLAGRDDGPGQQPVEVRLSPAHFDGLSRILASHGLAVRDAIEEEILDSEVTGGIGSCLDGELAIGIPGTFANEEPFDAIINADGADFGGGDECGNDPSGDHREVRGLNVWTLETGAGDRGEGAIGVQSYPHNGAGGWSLGNGGPEGLAGDGIDGVTEGEVIATEEVTGVDRCGFEEDRFALGKDPFLAEGSGDQKEDLSGENDPKQATVHRTSWVWVECSQRRRCFSIA